MVCPSGTGAAAITQEADEASLEILATTIQAKVVLRLYLRVAERYL
jgi:hypothetical protein